MLENINLALQGVWSHKLRSFLTMLGIIIGIAAIITIVSTIRGTNEQIKQNLIGAGNDMVQVQLTQDGSVVDLSYGEIPEGIATITSAMRDEMDALPGVSAVAMYHQRTWADDIYAGNNSFTGTLNGVDDHYLSVAGYQVNYGRAFLPEDFSSCRKVAVIDATGKVLDTAVVYPTFSERKKQEAIDTLKRLIDKHGVKHLAIGNGTASRETEAMAVELIRKCPGVSYMIVNEAGASVYSASKLAAEEFPQFDVNLRSAVSIARRLQDPLAELVKIDPKAIGVGQYQHDMPEKELDSALGAVVESCVNAVGVDVNTASMPLLKQVSGLNATTAKNIVLYREENGAFTARAQLKKVPKLGPKAFEQAAGFLRVPESGKVLDNTGVHPESYKAAEQMLTLCGLKLSDVGTEKLKELPARVKLYGEEKLAQACEIGVPTMQDIVKELVKPGRDPRDELPAPILRTDVLELKDLKPGMELSGTVRNVIDFGVFVDIGVHQDGLVHISQVCNKYIRHPSEVVSVGDVVKVKVLEVDEKRKRISLTMKGV